MRRPKQVSLYGLDEMPVSSGGAFSLAFGSLQMTLLEKQFAFARQAQRFRDRVSRLCFCLYAVLWLSAVGLRESADSKSR